MTRELGMPVKWVSFDAGTAMSAAMASGDVHIAVSQGVTPFLTAVSAGQDLQAIDIALTYSDNDNCVVRKNLEITKDNAKELEGKTVGVPLSTAAHTGFLAQMAHFGVDTSTMKIVDMARSTRLQRLQMATWTWFAVGVVSSSNERVRATFSSKARKKSRSSARFTT